MWCEQLLPVSATLTSSPYYPSTWSQNKSFLPYVTCVSIFCQSNMKRNSERPNSTSDISSVGTQGISQSHVLFIIEQFWGRQPRSYCILVSLGHRVKGRYTHDCNLRNTSPLSVAVRSRDRYNLSSAVVMSDHSGQSCGTEDEMTRYYSCCQLRLPAAV